MRRIPMMLVLLFYTVVVACCAYAAIYGGATGRVGASIFVTTALASSLVSWGVAWGHPNWSLAIVDTACLVALFILAKQSGRFWPIWATGFQLLAVLTHVAKAIEPNAAPKIYRALETFWALPVLVFMVIGIMLDRRADNLRDQGDVARRGKFKPRPVH